MPHHKLKYRHHRNTPNISSDMDHTWPRVYVMNMQVICSGESIKTSPPDTAYTTDTQSDDCTSQNSLSIELGNTTQVR